MTLTAVILISTATTCASTITHFITSDAGPIKWATVVNIIWAGLKTYMSNILYKLLYVWYGIQYKCIDLIV